MPTLAALPGSVSSGPGSGAHCNGVVIFEDTGELLPDGASIEPHRPTDLAAFDRPIGVVSRPRGQAPAALSAADGISRGHPRCPV